MQILQVLPELNEGRVERSAVELHGEFIRRGVDILVISNGDRLVERKYTVHFD